MPALEFDAIVIGGGIYGCALALHLRKTLPRVAVFENASDIMQRATFANQARVHNGYHYPRSILTAKRSRINFTRFVRDYRDCIDDTFDKYYAVGKLLSKVTANQFKTFCQRIEAPIGPPPGNIRKLFNSDLIEDVFRVQEFAFDAIKLKAQITRDLFGAGVDVRLRTTVTTVFPGAGSTLEVGCSSERTASTVTAGQVFNCTYSQINRIHAASGLAIVPLKHELAELALVEVPESFRKLGITVMCGPFFSIMPFPSAGLHTLSHVRYTPHCSWQDTPKTFRETGEALKNSPPQTHYPHMIRDAVRYVPGLQGCRYLRSLWEVKTVLPSTEADDSRPILFLRPPQLPNFATIMGSKLDNVYDLFDELKVADVKENAANGCQ